MIRLSVAASACPSLSRKATVLAVPVLPLVARKGLCPSELQQCRALRLFTPRNLASVPGSLDAWQDWPVYALATMQAERKHIH